MSSNLVLPSGLTYTSQESIDLAMLTLLIGREAGNQPNDAMLAVACSVRNRVAANLHRFGGNTWTGVMTARWQYSSINGPANDPNLLKYVHLPIIPWAECLSIAELVYKKLAADNSGGAHSYFDKSLDRNPPRWSTDGEYMKTIDVGDFHFFKLAAL